MSRFMGTKVLNGREQYYVRSIEPDGQIALIDGPSITLGKPAQASRVRTGDIIRFYVDGSRHFIMHTRPHNQSVDGTARLISYITDYSRSDEDPDADYDDESEGADFDDDLPGDGTEDEEDASENADGGSEAGDTDDSK